MKSIGIYEVKTKITEIFEEVQRTHESVLVTRRGQPLVRIDPIYELPAGSEVWEARSSYIGRHGDWEADFAPPARTADEYRNPIEEDQ